MPHAKVKVTHTPEEGGDRGGGGREGEDCLSCFPLVSVLSRQPCRMCKIVLKSLSQCGCFRLKRLTSFSAVRVGCGGEAVGLQCDGGPAVCCPSECQYILTHCMHIMLGDVVGLQCPSHHSSIFLPYCQHPPNHPPTYPPSPPPPLFHSHIRPEVRQPCLQNSQSQYCVRDRAIHYGENKVLSVSSALGHQLKTSRQHRGTEGGGATDLIRVVASNIDEPN